MASRKAQREGCPRLVKLESFSDHGHDLLVALVMPLLRHCEVEMRAMRLVL